MKYSSLAAFVSDRLQRIKDREESLEKSVEKVGKLTIISTPVSSDKSESRQTEKFYSPVSSDKSQTSIVKVNEASALSCEEERKQSMQAFKLRENLLLDSMYTNVSTASVH